jgi:hypothetical protein
MPYSTLAELGGKILCIGIGDNLVGFRHQAQELAGLLARVPYRRTYRYRDGDGQIKNGYRIRKAGCVKRLPELVALLRDQNLVNEGKVCGADAILVPARESLEILTEALKSDPTLNLCDDMTCLWCRRLEWSMNLYDMIENPRFYQSNPIVRRCMAMINWVRLKEIPLLTRLRQHIK